MATFTDLEPVHQKWLEAAFQRVASEGAKAVPELFPALPRHVGRGDSRGGMTERKFGAATARADFTSWRRCDVVALEFLDAAKGTNALLLDLYRHGDLDEKIMAARCTAFGALDADLVLLLDEFQRQNVESLFAAGACDSNLLVRASGYEPFGMTGFNRMTLKAAFLGLPLSRVHDATSKANAELSRMLLDLASEREAAGRAVWPDTLELAAYAPSPGTIARILGGIEHGDDKLRRGAARALVQLNRRDLAPFAKERLAREPRPEIRDLLTRAAGA